MKKTIIMILSFTFLLSLVSANPKKVDTMDINGYEAVIWDVGTSQKFVTIEDPAQLFLAEILLKGPMPVDSIKTYINKLHPDLQKLIAKYEYYLCYLDDKLIAVVYKNDENTTWSIIY